jgi:hypothetical protein
MSGAIPPLPQYAFMAWCSVKAQGQLYLYLLPLASRRVGFHFIVEFKHISSLFATNCDFYVYE